MRRAIAVAMLVMLAGSARSAAQSPDVVADVRAAIARQDFAGGERIVAGYRSARGVTPEMLEALSWLGRGALAARQFAAAERYARDTYDLATVQLKTRPLDREPRLPMAFGAAIEVLAHVRAQQGALTEAVAFLQRELDANRGTSVEKRIQKNIHLLSLEGKAAPRLELSDFLGPKPASLGQLEGKVVLLFFWAHWCADCKAQAPILARVAARYRNQGLVLVAPTQRFGYVAGGAPAAPDVEKDYIELVRRTSYPVLADAPIPLSAANHTRYGVSTTPTLVLVDREGIVRLYHPGRIAEQELETLVSRTLVPAR